MSVVSQLDDVILDNVEGVAKKQKSPIPHDGLLNDAVLDNAVSLRDGQLALQLTGWRRVRNVNSENPDSESGMSDRSVAVPAAAGVWATLWAYLGPGLIVSVGYMDPGNWATDLAAGAQFGYSLLFVVFLSNAIAIHLQYLSLKLGNLLF